MPYNYINYAAQYNRKQSLSGGKQLCISLTQQLSQRSSQLPLSILQVLISTASKQL